MSIKCPLISLLFTLKLTFKVPFKANLEVVFHLNCYLNSPFYKYKICPIYFIKSVHLTDFLVKYSMSPIFGCPKRTSNSSIKLSGTCHLTCFQSHMVFVFFTMLPDYFCYFTKIAYFGHVHFWSNLVYFVSNI